MELKFGISGILKPQRDKKDKVWNKSSTLKRKWSLKLPTFDKSVNEKTINHHKLNVINDQRSNHSKYYAAGKLLNFP